MKKFVKYVLLVLISMSIAVFCEMSILAKIVLIMIVDVLYLKAYEAIAEKIKKENLRSKK